MEGRCNGGLQRSAGARLPGRARTRLPGGEGRPDDLPVADRQARTPCVQAQGQVAGASRLALARRGRRRSWRQVSDNAIEGRPDGLPSASEGTPGGLPVAARQCLPARSASGGPMRRLDLVCRRGAAAWAGANAPATGRQARPVSLGRDGEGRGAGSGGRITAVCAAVPWAGRSDRRASSG